MKPIMTWPLVLTLLVACATPSRTDPKTAMEIVTLAAKACTDRFGSRSDFSVDNWRVRADRDMWLAETVKPNPPPACGYAVYLSMSDRMPDFLGCEVCVTVS